MAEELIIANEQAIKEWADRVTHDLNDLIDHLMPEALCIDGIKTFSTVADDLSHLQIYNGVYKIADALGLDVVVTDRDIVDDCDPYKYRHSVIYNGIEFYMISATNEGKEV